MKAANLLRLQKGGQLRMGMLVCVCVCVRVRALCGGACHSAGSQDATQAGTAVKAAAGCGAAAFSRPLLPACAQRRTSHGGARRRARL